jgi:nucleotide-binding universal stress UspA family protein
MFQRLLICTDLTDGLQRLANFVPSLAASGIKHITFLHVIPLPEGREIPRPDPKKTQDAHDRLAVAQQQALPEVTVEISVQWGRPLDLILSTIKTARPDLVLLGTPVRSLFTEKLFGSTAAGLYQRITVPVMIFRPQLLSAYTCEELELRCRHLFRYLLIPYDGSKTADYLVSRIKQQAQDRSPDSLQSCLLAWVVRGGRREIPIAAQKDNAQAKLNVVRAELEALNLAVETQVLEGEEVLEMLLTAAEHDISAIATASDTFGKLVELSARSFTGEILRRSWHPVIYFPPVRG